jgi:hypothetical protein
MYFSSSISSLCYGSKKPAGLVAALLNRIREEICSTLSGILQPPLHAVKNVGASQFTVRHKKITPISQVPR